MTVPDTLVRQFRVVALERLERVETAWATVLSGIDDDAVALIHREIHTLKGESQILGFTEVNLVCHRLEDLLEVARACGYAVDEDFDLAVNMALRFMAMLVRKKAGSELAGIDLPAFVQQIDRVLAEARGEITPRTRASTPSHRSTGTAPRVSAGVRMQLSPAAVDLFLEYASARSTRRNRLRTSWHTLRDLVGVHRALIGTGQLAKHEVGAQSVAKELGKQIDVTLEIGSAEITTDLLATLDLAVLHLVRNAIDHGIEAAEVRTAAGKPAAGALRVIGGAKGDMFELTVEDDGAGIDYDKVRQRAVELGLHAPTGEESSERWLDLLCHQGFSTRTETSAISGRGVGLDAVRASITEVGGRLAISSVRGKGTSWKLTAPLTQLQVAGHRFQSPDVPVPVVIDASWQVERREQERAPVLDLGAFLGFTSIGRESHFLLWFSRGDRAFGIASSDLVVQPVQARKLVVTPATSAAEIITLDGVEGLLVRPEVLLATHRARS